MPGRAHPQGVSRSLPPFVRALAILWALPTTLVGLLLLALARATGGRAALVDGVLEAHGGLVRRALMRLPLACGGDVAVTLGHVVLGTSASVLDATRAHERVHVAQCERWGPFFLPAYAIASLVARLRGADPYLGNRFEREAFERADARAAHAARLSGRDPLL